MAQKKNKLSGAFVAVFFLLVIGKNYPQTYNIEDFGAVNDSVTVNTSNIQMAIDSCALTGGTVYVPSGVFVTGTFQLRRKVNLYLERGAVLLGSPEMNDYRDYQAPNFSSPSQYGIVYAHKAHEFSITGLGAISGNEEAFFGFDKAKNIEWGGVGNTKQKESFRKPQFGIGDGPVFPRERPRQMIIFSECKNVLVKNVQLLKSPFCTLHFADCDGVIARGLKILTSLETPNSDGIDITSSKNVLVSDCDIRKEDDAIAITGYSHHYELPGYEGIKHLSENINITNCNLQSRSSGIRIGYIDQNLIRNIHVGNVNFTNSNRGIGIFTRGVGSLENITISQVFIETRLHTGDWWGNREPIHISSVKGEEDVKLGGIKNVFFWDITCKGENEILVYGSKESPIKDLQFYNVKFKFLKSELNDVAGGSIDLRGSLGVSLFKSDISAFYAQQVEGMELENFEVQWEEVEADYFKHGIYHQF